MWWAKIPREFIPAVQKGFTQAMVNGLSGIISTQWRCVCSMVHGTMMWTLIHCRSEWLHALASKKPRKYFRHNLEPIMGVEVVTPDEFMGSVTGDLNLDVVSWGGMDSRGTARVIKSRCAVVWVVRLYHWIWERLHQAVLRLRWRSHTMHKFLVILAEKVIEEVKGRS